MSTLEPERIIELILTNPSQKSFHIVKGGNEKRVEEDMSKTSAKITAKVKHFWGAHKVWRVVIVFAAFVFVIGPLISGVIDFVKDGTNPLEEVKNSLVNLVIFPLYLIGLVAVLFIGNFILDLFLPDPHCPKCGGEGRNDAWVNANTPTGVCFACHGTGQR